MPAVSSNAKQAIALRRVHWALAGVLLLTALVYLPGLSGPLVLDDRHNLAPLAALGGNGAGAWRFVFDPGEGAVARPVARLSFLLDWSVSGDDVRSFKRTNLLLHLLCGVLVFALASRVLARQGAERSEVERAALFASACWLLTPMLLSTVLYTVQRMAQLSALFTLAGLLCYVRGREIAESDPARAGALVLATFVAFWPLAALSKENGALLPLLAGAVELWLFAPGGIGHWHRRLVAALTALGATAVFVRIAFDPHWLLAGYALRDFTLADRLWTQPRVLFEYVANLLLLPGATPLGLLHDDYVASRGPFSPATTALALAGWVAVALLALRTRRTPLAPIGLGVALFLAAHSLESGPFALELYFEHRNYLPAVGLFLALAAGALALLEGGRARAAVLATMLVLPAVYLVATLARAQVWSNTAQLYARAAETHPRSARAQLGVAAVHFDAGRFEEGLSTLGAAQSLMGANAAVGIALQALAAYCVHGRPPPESVYRRFEDARVLGADLHTINGLAWIAGAVSSGACAGLDRARLGAALERLPSEPTGGDVPRARLRSAHLEHLLSALREAR